MKRVTGIGGVFFKARDPKALGEWYCRHRGIAVEDWGGCVFGRATDDNPGGVGSTVWSPFKPDTACFAPSPAAFMITCRVDRLHALPAALRDDGCDVDDKVEESEPGRFDWVMDPEGHRIAPWHPPAGP